MNNTEKTLKNSIISVVTQVIIFFLLFINRRIFVMFLDIEYLGYQSLFGNIFTILSVAELGIGQVISFHLYREIANHNEDEIGKLMHIYKWVYRIVAVCVLTLGMSCFPFLQYFVKDATVELSYLRLIYLLQLFSMFVGYFLSYKSIMFTTTQQEYKNTQVTFIVTILTQIFQLILLAVFHNYLVYLIVNLSTAFLSNLIIAIKVDKEYPFLKKRYKITKEDIRKRDLIQDTGNFLIHKISYAVYGGTDNIIISAICGIRMVGLYGNYVTVKSSIMNIFFYKLLNPVQAAIGNIIYGDRKKEDLWNQFRMLDVFSFFFASYIGLGFLVFYQPFIQLWMGKDYLLPFSFVLLYSISIYFSAVFEIVCKYRAVFGDYKQDRNLMVLSAVMNIVVSIVGAKCIGITGVQLGTLIAFVPIVYGRIRFVVGNYFDQSIGRYILKHLVLFGVVCFEGAICYLVTVNMPINSFCFLLRGIVWLLVPFIINVLIYFRNPYFKRMLVYFKQIIGLVIGKIKRN